MMSKKDIHYLALTVRQMKIKFGKASFNTLLKIKIKIELKPFQNKKGQTNLRYPTKKQPFSLEKDCFFVGYLKFFWPFLF